MNAEGLVVTFVAFLTVAVLVAYLASKLRVPYTIAMVLTGLAVSIFRQQMGFSPGHLLEPEIILLIFLPGLLFEAAYHIDLGQLRANLRPIIWLAIPGIFLSTFLLGFLLHWELQISLIVTLLFGVLISATDPIAVVALFKELGVDKRLGTIVEGESLFNDGVAIVLYSILVGLAAGTSTFSLGDAVASFFITVVGGLLLGAVLGFLFAELMKRTTDSIVNIALTAILAYGGYVLAEELLHGLVSPVITIVVAAIVVGNYGASGRHSAASTTTIISFWEFAVFIINSAIFLLIGLEVEISEMVAHLVPVLIAIATILITRALVVYLLRSAINVKGPHIPMKWAHIIFWGGMRGGVSIALVLSLPTIIEARGVLTAMAFGYVLFSVVVQGLTIKPLLNRLGLTRRSEKQQEFEESVAKIAVAQSSIAAIDRMQKEHLISKMMSTKMRERFEGWLNEHELDLERLIAADPGLADVNAQIVRRELADEQKQSLRLLLRRGIISEETYEGFSANIDTHLSGKAAGEWILSRDVIHGVDELLAHAGPVETPATDTEEASL